MLILSRGRNGRKIRGVYNIDALGPMWGWYNTYSKMDQLFVGDSWVRGLSAYNIPYNSFPHRYKLLLQDRFNPGGILGGYGTVRPSQMVSNTAHEVSGGTSGSLTNLSTNAPSASMLELPVNASVRVNRAYHRFNGGDANARFLRSNVEYVDFSYANNPTSGAGTGGISAGNTGIYSLCTDISVGSAPGTSAGGAFAATPSVNAGTAKSFTRRQSSTALTRTADHYIQVGCGSTFGGGGSAFCTNIITYDGDYTNGYGIRVHNLGSHAKTLSAWVNDSDAVAGTIGQYCLNTGHGARYAKSVCLVTGNNEAAPSTVSPNRTVAQLEADQTTLLAACAAQPTTPILKIISEVMAAGTTDGWVRGSNNPADYPAMQKEFALANNLFYIDLHEYVLGTDRQTINSFADFCAMGWGMESDLIHPGTMGHALIAELLFECDCYVAS